MSRRLRSLLWVILLALMVIGVFRLHFDTEVLNLLPPGVRAVQGLKLYQQNFSNARELIITIRSPSAETTEATARSIADELSKPDSQVSSVTWQPPWLEHPDQAAELLGYLWFNQPPQIFGELTNRLAQTNLSALLNSARDQLAISMSPADIAQLSYDPFALTHLPENVSSAAPSFATGNEMFANSNGTFRIMFVEADRDLATFRECDDWLREIKDHIQQLQNENKTPRDIAIGYTGRPAFVSEIAAGMKHDIQISVIGTSVIIAILFYIAHRRVKPMLWLLTLLALILGGTLTLGGLIFGAINVVSMGFAAILLGLAVDYAVVHYQEALAHPDLSVPEIRRAIAPSIFWAAVTTICAFLVLNFGGLPGLAQLGTLVGVGVALAALVMIFFFLPPLFPERRTRNVAANVTRRTEAPASQENPPPYFGGFGVITATVALALFAFSLFFLGFPKMDPTANALRPRDSAAYGALDDIKNELAQQREPLWVIVSGKNEGEIATRLDAVNATLKVAVSNNILSDFISPAPLWPRPENQNLNRSTANALASQKEVLRAAALSNGFSETSVALTSDILATWQRAWMGTGVFWPTNNMSRWIFNKLVARTSTNLFALGLLYPNVPSSDPRIESLQAQLDEATQNSQLTTQNSIWLSGWELLGGAILTSVKSNLWKLILPIVGLVLLSLWLAFRRAREVLLSISILILSGFCLLAVMRLAGWSWNLLNLMALPLILGTGVDYSIFMQLALRRHHGDLKMAHRSVGRALLLCGGTAVSGFGALAFSSNQGMASLGQVCAVGIACNVVISVFLLPVWWKNFQLVGADEETR
jgi:predicted exporter